MAYSEKAVDGYQSVLQAEQRAIAEEQKQFGDLIELDLVDTYRNLPEKLIKAVA